MVSYENVIQKALADGGLMDALLALQKRDGYVSEAGLTALAAYLGKSAAELYDTASFYSMLRFTPPAKTEIRVCRGTACHSGGNGALIKALEEAVGIKMGESSNEAETGLKMGESNETYGLDWVECLGQCQAAPNLLINGKLYTGVDPARIPELLGGDK